MVCIDIYLNNMNDVFDKYDNNKISSELSKHIYNKCIGTSLKQNINLNIICNFELDDIQKDKIKDMIKHDFGIHIREHLIFLKYTRIRSLYLFIIGIIFITLSRLVNYISAFLIGEILLIVGWVSIWEATYNLIFDSSKKKIEIKRFKKLTKSDINFKHNI